MAEIVLSIDLRGKIPPIRSKYGRFVFLKAIGWEGASRIITIRYAQDGVEQELGVRMDMDKKVILDDFSDRKIMNQANISLRKRRAPQIWQAIADELQNRRRQAAAGSVKLKKRRRTKCRLTSTLFKLAGRKSGDPNGKD